MKAFLSHSSRDKALVAQVADLLGTANIEMDSETFDRGILNVQAISQSLSRCSLFVLFLSKFALESKIVHFEALLAEELRATGVIDRFLVVCLDEESFAAAEENWKRTNFIRRIHTVSSIARLIQNSLIASRSSLLSQTQPYVGRTKELEEAKEQLTNPDLGKPRFVFVSGNAGIGRRTFLRRLFNDVFPSVGTRFPEVFVDSVDGYEELFRKVLDVAAPLGTLSALKTRLAAFAIGSENDKALQIALLIQNLVNSRETLLLHDRGGVLNEEGDLQPPLKNILTRIDKFPHPAIAIVAERRVVHSKQDELNPALFSSLTSLSRNEVRQLAALLFRDANIRYTNADLEKVVELSDGHPFNVKFILEAAESYTLPVFLANPISLIQWKRSRGSDFIKRIAFSEVEKRILGTLREFNALDFETIVSIADTKLSEVGLALSNLLDKHVLESNGGLYLVSPPLRAAVERERRLDLTPRERQNILSKISSTLNANATDEIVTVSMVEAGVIARLQEQAAIPEFFSAFLLPSHHVWLARRRYDQKHLEESIRLVTIALQNINRLSPAGKIEACKILCLASARLGQQETFDVGIATLKSFAQDAWARSNVNFLKGFNARLQGRLPEAEVFLRNSIADSPGNFSAIRELASICMMRGDVESAENFAREAYSKAPDNPYILDMLLTTLLSQLQKRGRLEKNSELTSLFERLERVGEEEGHSFFTTRRAEYEWRLGNSSEACKLIDEAAKRTPSLFNVHALRARILP